VPFSSSNRNSKSGDFISSLYVISLAAIYVLVMIFIVKPFLKRIGDLYSSKDSIGKPVLAIFFLLILSSYATVIGIHALLVPL
jgi:Kef-type K+ transport system membrane component KefB